MKLITLFWVVVHATCAGSTDVNMLDLLSQPISLKFWALFLVSTIRFGFEWNQKHANANNGAVVGSIRAGLQ